MTVFRVGPDDSKTGLFGHPRTTVELEDAINNSASGDTILIQAGYSTPQPRNTYVIEKNLTIIGNVNEDDTDNFPIIYDGIKADNGASITIRNLNFYAQEAERNILQADNGSNLRAENIKLSNVVEEGNVYPVVYIDNKSTGNFNKVIINSNKKYAGNITIDNESTINISNSEISVKIMTQRNASSNLLNSQISCSVAGKNNAKLKVQGCTISHDNGNSVNLKAQLI